MIKNSRDLVVSCIRSFCHRIHLNVQSSSELVLARSYLKAMLTDESARRKMNGKKTKVSSGTSPESPFFCCMTPSYKERGAAMETVQYYSAFKGLRTISAAIMQGGSI